MLGVLIVISTAAVVWLLVFYEPQGGQTASRFRVDLVRSLRNGATNVVVFRLSALDGRYEYSLLSPGTVSTPLPPAAFAPSFVFPEAVPSPVYGRWTLGSLPSARWTTNFIPITFRRQVEFAIIAPTNDVWRLNVQISRVLSRTEVLAWKTQKALDSAKRKKFSAITGAWSGPWSVTLSYSTWSAPFTNPPAPDSQM